MLKELLWENTDRFWIQLLRYTVVGGFSFLVDFFLLYGLTEYLYFHYLTSATISFAAGLTVNYILSRGWVFVHSHFLNKWTEFALFAGVGFSGLRLNNLIIWLFTAYFSLYYMYSKLVATLVVYGWNFLARKYWVFKK